MQGPVPRAHYKLQNFLPFLTPGGVYGDPWEEVYPTGTAPFPTDGNGNPIPEDQITSISAAVISGGGGNIHQIDGSTLTIAAMQVQVSKGESTADSLTGGVRVQGDLDLTITGGDIVQPAYTFNVTVKDQSGAEYSQAIVVQVDVTGTDVPPGQPPSPLDPNVVFANGFPQKYESFLNNYIVTIPPAALGQSPQTDLFHHLNQGPYPWAGPDNWLVQCMREGIQRQVDWYYGQVNGSAVPLFPGLSAWQSMSDTVADETIIQRDDNTQWRALLIPCRTDNQVPTAWFTVTGVTSNGSDASGDFTDLPQVFRTTGDKASLGIKFRLKPNLAYPSPKVYLVTIDLADAAKAYFTLSQSVTQAFAVMDLQGAAFKPKDHVYSMDLTRNTVTPTLAPVLGSVGADGQLLTLLPLVGHPWLDGNLSQYIQSRWEWGSLPLSTWPMPIGFTATPVDVGSGATSPSPFGTTQLDLAAGKSAIVRGHRVKLQEVQADGSLTTYLPYYYTTRVSSGSPMGLPDLGGNWSSYQMTDPIGRQVTTTNGTYLNGSNDPPRTGSSAAEQSLAAQIGLGNLPQPFFGTQARNPNWSSYTNAAEHWSLRASISHTGTAGSAAVSAVSILDAHGATTTTIPAGSVIVGGFTDLCGSSVASYLSANGCPASPYLLAFVPMGQPSSWASGPSGMPLIMPTGVQPSGSQPYNFGYTSTFCFPVVQRDGQWNVLCDARVWNRDRPLAGVNAGGNWGSADGCYILRADDQVWMALILREVNNSNGATRDHQWVASADAARLDVVDQSCTLITALNGTSPPLLSYSNGRSQPWQLTMTEQNMVSGPMTWSWVTNGGATTVATGPLNAGSLSDGYGGYNYSLASLSGYGVTENIVVQASDVPSGSYGYTQFYTGAPDYIYAYVSGGQFSYWDDNSGNYISTPTISLNPADVIYLDVPAPSPMPAYQDILPVTGATSGTVYTYRVTFGTADAGFNGVSGTMIPTAWSASGGSAPATGSIDQGMYDSGRSRFIVSLGTPVALGMTDGLLIWPDQTFTTSFDNSTSFLGITSASNGTTTWYRPQYNNGYGWNTYDATLGTPTGWISGYLSVQPADTVTLAVPGNAPGPSSGSNPHLVLKAESLAAAPLYDTSQSAWWTLPSSRHLVWRQMVRNPRGSLERGIPVPTTATVPYGTRWNGDAGVRMVNIRALVRFTFDRWYTASGTWLRDGHPTTSRLYRHDQAPQDLTPTYLQDAWRKDYEYSSSFYDMPAVTFTPADLGMPDGAILWNPGSYGQVCTITRQGGGQETYRNGYDNNGNNWGNYLVINPGDSVSLGVAIYSHSSGWFSDSRGPYSSWPAVSFFFEPLTAGWSQTTASMTVKAMPTLAVGLTWWNGSYSDSGTFLSAFLAASKPLPTYNPANGWGSNAP